MNKTYRTILKTTLFMVVILSMFFIFPSTSYAKEVLTITALGDGKYESSPKISGKGTEKEPFQISLKYDEIVVNYAGIDKFEFPFYFQIYKQGNLYIGKYLIDVNYEEKVVVFTKIGATSTVGGDGGYAVSPGTRNEGSSYVQAGAVYDENSVDFGFTYPLYKIVATEKIQNWAIGGWMDYWITTTLGNTHLQVGNSIADNAATYPSAYVFCASDIKRNQAYKFTDAQVGKFIDIKIGDTNTRRKIVSNSEIQGVQLDNSNMAGIIYAFYGSSSEILDQNQADTIEQVLSKILISIGDIFMKTVRDVGGETLNIDAIVFNEYDPVIVDYFETRGSYLGVIQSVVNGWYEAFSVWTRVVLLVVLVAIGVKAMILSGTSGQSKINGLISGWVMAVMFFIIGPYFMKYTIALNDGMVKILRDQSKYSLYSVFNVDFNDESGDKRFQYGEDSQTKYIDYLYGLQEDINEDIDSISGEIAEKKKQMSDYQKNLSNLIKKGYKIRILPESGRGYYSYILARIKIESLIKQGDTVDEAMQKVAGGGIEVEEPTSSGIVGIVVGTVTEITIRNNLTQYATTYKEYMELQEKLDKINRAINITQKNIDLMGMMRQRAAATYRLVYVAVWYILIVQLVGLLFIYYKRLLTVAMLIVIFPLVIMFYAIEKFMGIDKPQSMSTWIKEYLVNIFVQSVHALLYVMLVETGLEIFEADSDNWILFVMAVMALFPMESVLKAIMGMKSSTVGDLMSSAKKGAGYIAAASAIRKAGGKGKDVKNAYNNRELKIGQSQQRHDKMFDFIENALENSAARKESLGLSNTSTLGKIEGLRNLRESLDEWRGKAADFRKGAYYTRRAAQPLMNTMAKMNAISAGIAGGGDSEDFVAGAAAMGVLAGSARNVPKLTSDNDVSTKNSNSSASSNATTQAQNTSIDGTNNTAQPNGNINIPTSGGMAADNARAAVEEASNANPTVDYGNGRVAPTLFEAMRAEHEARKTSKLQDAFRQNMQPKQAEVSATDDYDIIYDDRDSE